MVGLPEEAMAASEHHHEPQHRRGVHLEFMRLALRSRSIQFMCALYGPSASAVGTVIDEFEIL